MRKAFGLAERGRGRTSPNPLVGAVVVDGEGVIVGRGAHLEAGGPHAEVFALRDAGARAAGATLYCTLEPCSHVGRTGACAPLVTSAGIARVVVAIEDPNPLVAGAGLRHLREHGVAVRSGVLREQAEEQNAAFLTSMRRRRPLVIVKAAISLDGRVAARPGERTRLTGPEADRWIHRQRAAVDALAVGSGTVLADDPLLTARGVHRWRPLTRVLFDTRLRTPTSARVLSTRGAGPVIIMTTEEMCARAPERAEALAAAGAELERLPERSVKSAMERLGARGITSIVVEGGPALHRAALGAGVVDAVQVYIAPRTLGPDALAWIDRDQWMRTLRDRQVRVIGDDVLVEGHVHRTD